MRKILAVLALFFAVGMLATSLRPLGLALHWLASGEASAAKHLYVQEYFITFALELTIGLVLGWWGISQFRRRKSVRAKA